jgi:hypothetical protein
MANKKFQYDIFGNMIVWLPFGTPTIIEDYGHGSYIVTRQQIENIESNRTLAGIDITVWHPTDSDGNQTFVTPENYNDVTVGTSIGEYRIVDNVGEVKCLIKNSLAQDLIKSGSIEETSPCYVQDAEGNRLYNHICMIPNGYARGGRTMLIKTEGINKMEIEKIAEMASVKTVEAIKIMMAEGDDHEAKFEAQLAKAKLEGYQEGLSAGKYITFAGKIGYEGSDIEAAKAHILTTKFPKKSFEGIEESTKATFLEAAMCMVPDEEEEKKEAKNCESKLPVEVKIESYDASKVVQSKYWKKK